MSGWTVVVLWTLAALLIWFFASLAQVSDWMYAKQHLAGWAQAIGAVIAILGSAILFVADKHLAAESESFMRSEKLLSESELAWLVLDQADTQVRHIRDSWRVTAPEQKWQADSVRMHDLVGIMKDAIGKLTHPDLIRAIIRSRSVLFEVVMSSDRYIGKIRGTADGMERFLDQSVLAVGIAKGWVGKHRGKVR